MTHPSQEAQDSITLLKLLADIRAACGDNGKRMQDELVEHIRAGFAELALLRSQQACAHAFPERIMSVLKQVADRNPGGSLLPWEDGQGEPLQDDADAAIAWIASRSQQPVSGGERERFEAWMIDRGFEPFDLRRGHSGDYIDLETDGRWQAWQAARLREKQAEKRMEDLYQAVHFCVSEDREINIIRLHDYCSGEDISADAVIGEETKYGAE